MRVSALNDRSPKFRTQSLAVCLDRRRVGIMKAFGFFSCREVSFSLSHALSCFFFLSLHHSFVDVPLVTTIFLSSHNSVQILPMAEYSEWSRASETL